MIFRCLSSRADIRVRTELSSVGMGCLTPLGNSRRELWDGFRNARSGIRRIAHSILRDFPVQIAGEVRDIDPFPLSHSKDRPHVCRAAVLALDATRQALTMRT